MIVTLTDIADTLGSIYGTESTEVEQELIFTIEFNGFSAEVVISLSDEEEEGEAKVLEIDFWLKNCAGDDIFFLKEIELELLKLCNSVQEKTRWGKIQVREQENSGFEVALWCAIDITPNDLLHAKVSSTESLFLRTLHRLSSEFSEVGCILMAYHQGNISSPEDLELLTVACAGEA